MINKKVKLTDRVVDNFREEIGKSWSSHNESTTSTVLKYKPAAAKSQIKYHFHKPVLIDGDEDFPYYTQKMIIESYSDEIKSIDAWESHLNSIMSMDSVIPDHHFETSLPEQLKNGLGYQFKQNASSYRVEPRYDFIAENYENYVNRLSERTLPNI